MHNSKIIENSQRLKSYPNNKNKPFRTVIKIECFCGQLFEIEPYCFKPSKSCGCLKRKHPYEKTSTYKSWVSMKQRCDNKNNASYKWYGARGITYQKNWNLFLNFLHDMGEKLEGDSLDRIDNDGNYCKENCRWANIYTQNNNKSNTRYINYQGITRSLSEWCKILDLKYSTTFARMFYSKMPIEKCFSSSKWYTNKR